MPDATPAPHHRRKTWPFVLLGFLALAAILVAVWDWNWLRPIVAAQATAKLGRDVKIGHFDVELGRVSKLLVDDVTVANPADFPTTANSPFVRLGRLVVALDVPQLLAGRIVLPEIELDGPKVEAVRLPDGRANWTLPTSGTTGGAPPTIGDLQIADGQAHVVDPKLKADFKLDIATRSASDSGNDANNSAAASQARHEASVLTVQASGTYAGAPVTGSLVGGAVLSLRDAAHPWPIDLRLANGDTHVSIVGTIAQPLAFAGAHVQLNLAGHDMSDLIHLTGIPIPATPPYELSSNVDYRDRRIRLDGFNGRVGSSDIAGTIAVDPGPDRPVLTADLQSRQVELADLGGFIGTAPGRVNTPGKTPEQRAQAASAEASSKILPQMPVNLPRLRAADIHLTYKGAHIEGRSMPLDNVVVTLDIVDGHIAVHPVSFGVGHGSIAADIDVTPTTGNQMRGHANIDFRQVDVSRLMSATHAFQGAGTVGGTAQIDGSGASLAQILGNGNGEVKLFMNGGDLSALLIDLSGLEFGNALLSALGVPQRAPVECLIADLPLRNGMLDTRALLVATDEANITGSGSINLANEAINYTLRTEARHFSIGSLPAPIEIKGTLKNPVIRPGAELAARGGIAAGLGVLFPPLAMLPTIQLGLGEQNACAKTLADLNQGPAQAASQANHAATPSQAVAPSKPVAPARPQNRRARRTGTPP